METAFLTFWDKYGIFFYAGVFSTIAFMMSKRASNSKLLNHFVQASFVGVIIGILVRNYTDFVDELIFVVAAVAGYFALDILREVREFISLSSEFIWAFIRRKTGMGKEKSDSSKK